MIPIAVQGWNHSRQAPSNPNIRNDATLKGDIVGQLPASPAVTHGQISTDAPKQADGYTWQYYSLVINNQTVSGWIATELVREVEDVEKHYDFHLGSVTFSWTLAERDDIVDIINRTADRHNAYAEDLRTFAAAIAQTEGSP